MQSSTPPNQPRHRHDHHHHLRHHDNLRLGLDTDPSNPSTSLALSLHNPTANPNPNPNANPNANPTAEPARSSSPSTNHHHHHHHHHGSIISNQPCNAQLPSWAAFHPHNHNSSSPSQTPQAMALHNRSSSFSPSLSAPPPPPRPSGSHHLMHLSSSRFDDHTPASAGDSSAASAAPPLIPLELLPLRPSNNPSASMATPSLASHSAPQSAASFFWHPPPPPPPPPAPSMAVPPPSPSPSPSPSPAIPSQAAMPAIFSMSAHMPFPLNNLIPPASHSPPSPSLSPSPSPKLLLRRGLDMNQPPQYVGGDHEEASLDLDYYAGEVGQRTSESNNCLNVKRDRERSDGVLSDGAEHEDRTCEVSSRGSDEDIDVGGGSSRARKKLRLTKEQSTLLEESFKEHSTLNPKQKAELAKKLSLRPRQVEVWFQNRRARTKLKQTEVDCELLKRCCESLTEENRRLQKEVAELRAMKVGPPCVIARDLYMPLPAATLTMCPSCERLATHTSSGSAPAPGPGPGSGPGPAVAPISSAPPSQSSPKENQHQQSFNHMMAAAASNLKAALHNTPPSQSPSNLNHTSPNPIAMSNGNPGNSINTTNHNNSRSSSPNPGMAAVAVSPPTTTAAATAASNSSNAAHFSQYRFSQPPPLPSAAC